MSIQWAIDYYDSSAGLPLLTYESDTASLEEVPSEGVVFVWLRQTVNGQEFTFKCVGWDRYFIKEDEDGLRFGGWMEEASYGREFRWNHGEDHQHLTQLTGEPGNLEGCSVLHGVLVPQPDSITLGLE